MLFIPQLAALLIKAAEMKHAISHLRHAGIKGTAIHMQSLALVWIESRKIDKGNV